MADMKLKNCPFCGGEAQINEYPSSGTYWDVRCIKCNAATGLKMAGDGRKRAIHDWDQRAIDSTIEAQEAEIKRLTDALVHLGIYALNLEVDPNFGTREQIITKIKWLAQAALKEKGE